MMNNKEELYSSIQAAIDELNVERARELLKPLLQNNPSAKDFYLASKVAINNHQRVAFLEQALELDPFHANAHNTLKALKEGSPTPEEPTQTKTLDKSTSHSVTPPNTQDLVEDKKVTKSIRQMRGMFGFFGIIIILYALSLIYTTFVVEDGFYFILGIFSGLIGICFLIAFRGLGKRTRTGLNFARISSVFFLLAIPSILLPIFGIVYLVKLSKPEMKQTLSN